MDTKSRSVFAQHLATLLDQTNLFTRDQWSTFLNVPPSTIQSWLDDDDIPKSGALFMILGVLQESSGVELGPVRAFQALVDQPPASISPHSARMLPSLLDYFLGTSAGLQADRV